MSATDSSFESTIGLVCARLDLGDPFVVREFNEYRKEAEEQLLFSQGASQHLPLKSPESVTVAVQYIAELISASAAKEKLNLLTEKSKLVKSSLDIALRVHKAVTAESGFDIYVLAIRKEPSAIELREIHEKLISSSTVLADLPEEQLQSITQRVNYPVVRRYLSDLTSFLTSTGAEGRDFVRAICQGADVAARVLRKKDKHPAPIVFLSELSRDINLGAASKTAILNKKQPIGFVNA